MKNFIRAMNIFQFYMPEDWEDPFYCAHDLLMVRCNVPPSEMTESDANKLAGYGFFWDSDSCWCSSRYGRHPNTSPAITALMCERAAARAVLQTRVVQLQAAITDFLGAFNYGDDDEVENAIDNLADQVYCK